MNVDPREQARAYEDAAVEDAPEPNMPENRSEVQKVPEAVAAADITKRKDTTLETAETEDIPDAADTAVEQKLENHRAHGGERVRPTDVIARNTAPLAGRGMQTEEEMSNITRPLLAAGLRKLGDQAKQLAPLA